MTAADEENADQTGAKEGEGSDKGPGGPAPADDKKSGGDKAPNKKDLLDSVTEKVLKGEGFQAILGFLREPVIASFDEDGLTAEGGAPGVVGHLLIAIQGYMQAMGAVMRMRDLQFTNSVEVTLEPILPSGHVDELEERIEAESSRRLELPELREFVPRTVSAAHLAVHFLAEPEGASPLREIRAYGAGAVDQYVNLANYVRKRDGGQLTLKTSYESGQLAHPRAERIVAASKRPRPLEPVQLTIVGKLTRTDSDEAAFRVLLDRERIPPELDRRKQFVEGSYSDEARGQVERDSLWNQRVVAEVLAHRARVATRATPVFSRFEFVSLRRAAS